jgi:hypothetical protein
LKADWPGGSQTFHFNDRNFPERIGWKEVVFRRSRRSASPMETHSLIVAQVYRGIR